jgi:DNA-binding SARP family transcriptional activator
MGDESMAGTGRDVPNFTLPTIHLISSNDGPAFNALQKVADLLSSLDQQVSQARLVVSQLATQLNGQSDAPAGCSPPPRARSSEPYLPSPAPQGAEWEGLRLFCLGSFEVHVGQEAIPQRRNGKGRAILKYLAARPNQPVPRDVLLEALWPEEDPDVANNRLRVAMHHLRQVCVPAEGDAELGELVIFRDGCYMFNPAIPVWTDVEAFDAAWKAGARIERSGDLPRAIPHYEAAERLYRGDYFEDDSFEDWMLVRREELKETYLRVQDKLSHHWFAQGAIENAIDGWKKILVKDPWREDVYRHLMVSFARSGQRGVALHWFDLCTQVLDRELRLQPEPETLALHEQIRRGEVVHGLASQ